MGCAVGRRVVRGSSADLEDGGSSQQSSEEVGHCDRYVMRPFWDLYSEWRYRHRLRLGRLSDDKKNEKRRASNRRNVQRETRRDEIFGLFLDHRQEGERQTYLLISRRHGPWD